MNIIDIFIIICDDTNNGTFCVLIFVLHTSNFVPQKLPIHFKFIHHRGSTHN